MWRWAIYDVGQSTQVVDFNLLVRYTAVEEFLERKIAIFDADTVFH